MDKPNPSKRRSIHDETSLEEIKDNVKNNAIVTCIKALPKAQQEIVKNTIVENDLIALSSHEDLLDDVQQRIELKSKDHKTYARYRPQHKGNASSGTEELNSSPLKDIELEERKQKLKKEGKSNRSSGSREKQNLSNKLTVNQNTYQTKSNTRSHNNNKCKFLIYTFVAGICAIVYLYYFYLGNEEDMNIKILKCEKNDIECITNDVRRTLKNMQAKYTHQDKVLWQDVFIGIKSIIHDPKKPSIIVLLGDKTDPIDCLAVLLGNVSSNALSSGLLKLTPEEFENDMGTVITSLRSSIQEKKAVIVWDLLNINEEALKAFHNLCDRINPLVEEVIYIITIIADDYKDTMSPHEFVEKKLYKKLSGKIKEDTIVPLITRITDGAILKVKPEPDLTDCPLPKIVR